MDLKCVVCGGKVCLVIHPEEVETFKRYLKEYDTYIAGATFTAVNVCAIHVLR